MSIAAGFSWGAFSRRAQGAIVQSVAPFVFSWLTRLAVLENFSQLILVHLHLPR